MKLSRLLGAALLSVTFASSAQAQAFSVNFDDLLFGEPAEGLVSGGITFQNPAFDVFVGPASFECLDICTNGVMQGTVSGQLGFSFGGAVASLQLDLARINDFASYLTLLDQNGNAIEKVTLTPSPMTGNLFGAYFGGMFSWAAAGTFAHSAMLTHDFDADFDFEGYEIDNLSGTYAPAAVPEPMSLSLLGAGLIGLAVARRRRNR